MKTIIEMAREAGLHRTQHNLMSNPVKHRFSYDGYEENLEAFAALVRAEAQAEEREACAKVAGWLWQQFQDTKDAHERNTMESFNPHRFGFNLSAVQQSRQMMDAIRARGNT